MIHLGVSLSALTKVQECGYFFIFLRFLCEFPVSDVEDAWQTHGQNYNRQYLILPDMKCEVNFLTDSECWYHGTMY